MEPKMQTLEHEQLPEADIAQARAIIESLPWQNPPDHMPQNFGVSFEFLKTEGVIYVFRQNFTGNHDVSWVAFKLMYVDSGVSDQVLQGEV